MVQTKKQLPLSCQVIFLTLHRISELALAASSKTTDPELFSFSFLLCVIHVVYKHQAVSMHTQGPEDMGVFFITIHLTALRQPLTDPEAACLGRPVSLQVCLCPHPMLGSQTLQLCSDSYVGVRRLDLGPHVQAPNALTISPPNHFPRTQPTTCWTKNIRSSFITRTLTMKFL